MVMPVNGEIAQPFTNSEFKTQNSELSSDVPSPCLNVCKMDDAIGLCAGCYRTLDEIACWSSCTNAEKTLVLERVAERKMRLDTPHPD